VRDDRTYALSAEFDRTLKRAEIEGHSFYDLRRTFQTVAEGAHVLVAVQAIMGHTPKSNDMAAIYRQRVEVVRLLNVTNFMRQWLYGDQ
jgi:integrase